MIERIIPLLNKVVPSALAIKGLEKIDSRIGNFIAGALSSGYGVDAALDYMRSQFEPAAYSKEKQRLASSHNLRPDEAAHYETMKQQEAPFNALTSIATGGAGVLGGMQAAKNTPQEQSAANIIQEHSPDLHDYLQQLIQSGINPLMAATEAYKNPKYTKIIADMERNLRQKFPSIVESVFGRTQSQQQTSAPQVQQPMGNDDEALLARAASIFKM